ncbi:MAG: ATP-binding cassette domain-containing protein [Lentisphaeria bacterium]|nr:ATP-binding cassette domain-containing protein [Lentisphaeria bacterium]
MALLEIESLKIHYPVRGAWPGQRKYVRAVDGVSLTIDNGEILGLVGESGCGKSSLGRAVARLEEPTAGTIRLDGVDLASLKGGRLRAARKDFQMIFQDPYGSLNPRLTVFAALDEVLRLHGPRDRAARRAEAGRLLEMVGLDRALLDRYPHQFSGGQRQRIGIARALAPKPRLIIADEPVSALDVSVQAQIINLLGDIRRDTGTALLFIAHDLAVVEHISDRIAVMYLGHIVESGPAHEVCADPRHPYPRALLSAVPTVEPAGRKRILLDGDVPSPLDPPSGCPFHTRCPYADDRCRNTCPEPVVFGNRRQITCFRAGEQ